MEYVYKILGKTTINNIIIYGQVYIHINLLLIYFNQHIFIK